MFTSNIHKPKAKKISFSEEEFKKEYFKNAHKNQIKKDPNQKEVETSKNRISVLTMRKLLRSFSYEESAVDSVIETLQDSKNTNTLTPTQEQILIKSREAIDEYSQYIHDIRQKNDLESLREIISSVLTTHKAVRENEPEEEPDEFWQPLTSSELEKIENTSYPNVEDFDDGKLPEIQAKENKTNDHTPPLSRPIKSENNPVTIDIKELQSGTDISKYLTPEYYNQLLETIKEKQPISLTNFDTIFSHYLITPNATHDQKVEILRALAALEVNFPESFYRQIPTFTGGYPEVTLAILEKDSQSPVIDSGIILLIAESLINNKNTIPEDLQEHIGVLLGERPDINLGITHFLQGLDIPGVYMSLIKNPNTDIHQISGFRDHVDKTIQQAIDTRLKNTDSFILAFEDGLKQEQENNEEVILVHISKDNFKEMLQPKNHSQLLKITNNQLQKLETRQIDKLLNYALNPKNNWYKGATYFTDKLSSMEFPPVFDLFENTRDFPVSTSILERMLKNDRQKHTLLPNFYFDLSEILEDNESSRISDLDLRSKYILSEHLATYDKIDEQMTKELLSLEITNTTLHLISNPRVDEDWLGELKDSQNPAIIQALTVRFGDHWKNENGDVSQDSDLDLDALFAEADVQAKKDLQIEAEEEFNNLFSKPVNTKNLLEKNPTPPTEVKKTIENEQRTQVLYESNTSQEPIKNGQVLHFTQQRYNPETKTTNQYLLKLPIVNGQIDGKNFAHLTYKDKTTHLIKDGSGNFVTEDTYKCFIDTGMPMITITFNDGKVQNISTNNDRKYKAINTNLIVKNQTP